jgi:YebC/PmpR family DNA-binding regulatory protein
MAGHSKWKNIRIRKGKQDAIRGKLFTKLSREIIVAAKMGGADPETNVRLRLAIAKAKESSVPRDNIERALAKGAGNVEGENYEELCYEGVGPAGVAFMVEVYSENKNRTVSELRHAFNKHGGGLTENGSVAWQFKSCLTSPRAMKTPSRWRLLKLAPRTCWPTTRTPTPFTRR